MFNQPSAGSDWRAKDNVGRLVLFYAREMRQNIVTAYGAAEALRVDLVVLDHPEGPKAEENILIFQTMRESLRSSIGKEPVLGRIGKGAPKGDNDPPYILQPYTEADAAYATHYLQSVGGDPFGQTRFQQAAPAQQTPPPPPAAPVAPQPPPAPPAPSTPQAPPAPQGWPQAPPPPPPPPAPPPPAPTPPAPPAAAPMVTLANGQQITQEAWAAMQQAGLQVPPAAPPQQ